MSWEQPQGSFTPTGYTVTVERVTGSGLCPDVEDNKDPVQRSPSLPLTLSLSELQEFSTYRVEVTAIFSEFGSNPIARPTATFMTPSAGM